MMYHLKKIAKMKRFIFTLTAVITMALSAQAMSYRQARSEALILTDRMAHELRLTPRQREAAFQANLSYLASVSHRDLYGRHWAHRNATLRHILDARQYRHYVATHHLYRPAVAAPVHVAHHPAAPAHADRHARHSHSHHRH